MLALVIWDLKAALEMNFLVIFSIIYSMYGGVCHAYSIAYILYAGESFP